MATSCWLKHLCSIRALVPMPLSVFLSFFSVCLVCLFLSSFLPLFLFFLPPSLPPFLSFYSFCLSLSISGEFLGAQRPAELTFLPKLLRPSGEGSLCLHPLRVRPVPTWGSASPKNRTLLAFRVNQGISAPFSLLLSGPPGSGPLKDQQEGIGFNM